NRGCAARGSREKNGLTLQLPVLCGCHQLWAAGIQDCKKRGTVLQALGGYFFRRTQRRYRFLCTRFAIDHEGIDETTKESRAATSQRHSSPADLSLSAAPDRQLRDRDVAWQPDRGPLEPGDYRSQVRRIRWLGRANVIIQVGLLYLSPRERVIDHRGVIVV